MKNLFLTTAAIMALTLPTVAHSMDYNTPSDNTYNNSSAPDNSMMNNSNDTNNNYDDNNHSSAGSTTSGPPSKTSGTMGNTSNTRSVTRSEFLNQGHTRQEFNCIDTNHNGRLSQSELSAGGACYTTGNQ